MVAILLADGFEEIEALSPLDALRRGDVETRLVGVTGRTVTGGRGVKLQADLVLAELDPAACDAVIVPGGLMGVENMVHSPAALEVIQTVYKAGGLVCAICAGPTVLAGLGITDGRRAVCYPGMEGQMGGARMEPGAAAVTDGPVITGRSAGTSWDFAFAILEKLRGRGVAERVARSIYYDHLQG